MTPEQRWQAACRLEWTMMRRLRPPSCTACIPTGPNRAARRRGGSSSPMPEPDVIELFAPPLTPASRMGVTIGWRRRAKFRPPFAASCRSPLSSALPLQAWRLCGKFAPLRFFSPREIPPPIFSKIRFDNSVYTDRYTDVNHMAGRWCVGRQNSFNRWRGWRDLWALFTDRWLWLLPKFCFGPSPVERCFSTRAWRDGSQTAQSARSAPALRRWG